jgi:hypothetical protein
MFTALAFDNGIKLGARSKGRPAYFLDRSRAVGRKASRSPWYPKRAKMPHIPHAQEVGEQLQFVLKVKKLIDQSADPSTVLPR